MRYVKIQNIDVESRFNLLVYCIKYALISGRTLDYYLDGFAHATSKRWSGGDPGWELENTDDNGDYLKNSNDDYTIKCWAFEDISCISPDTQYYTLKEFRYFLRLLLKSIINPISGNTIEIVKEANDMINKYDLEKDYIVYNFFNEDLKKELYLNKKIDNICREKRVVSYLNTNEIEKGDGLIIEILLKSGFWVEPIDLDCFHENKFYKINGSYFNYIKPEKDSMEYIEGKVKEVVALSKIDRVIVNLIGMDVSPNLLKFLLDVDYLKSVIILNSIGQVIKIK